MALLTSRAACQWSGSRSLSCPAGVAGKRISTCCRYAPFGAADNLVFAIWPKRKEDRDAPGEFWEQVLGDDSGRVEDADFLRGFGEGAAEVWSEVGQQR
jgi:hypothetical protein